MIHAAPAFLALLLVGCDGSTFQYSGTQMYKYFPLDGERSWDYMQEDPTFPYQLQVEKLSESYDVNGSNVFTLEYTQIDPLLLLYSVDWSSDSSSGILIHGYHKEATDTQDAEDVTFNPPVVVAEYQMMTDDQVVTESGGLTFTSTFLGKVECTNDWTSGWECVHISIDDGGAGLPFAGDYWSTTEWGVSWFQPSSFDEKWILRKATWNPNAE